MQKQTVQQMIDQHVNVPHQFAYEVGVVVTQVDRDYARGEVCLGPDSINPHGKAHGGVIMTLADTVAGCCACSRGGQCVTANQSMEFLYAGDGEKLICEAVPKKMGSSLSVVQVEIKNLQGRMVATGTFTFFMLHDED